MAGYYPCIIVALSTIYSHTTDAESTFITNKYVIKDHLLEEKRLLSSFKIKLPDVVCSLKPYEKYDLCLEVAKHLIGIKLEDLMGNGSLEDPPIAKKCPAFEYGELRVDGLDMLMDMYWCKSQRYEEKVPKLKAVLSRKTPEKKYDQIPGFFVAGSPSNSRKTVYVFRPKKDDAEVVVPVAELNNWSCPSRPNIMQMMSSSSR